MTVRLGATTIYRIKERWGRGLFDGPFGRLASARSLLTEQKKTIVGLIGTIKAISIWGRLYGQQTY